MAVHNDFGKECEEEASKFLRQNGYELIEMNWRFNQKEIDIIAKKDDLLVFVEVKGRNNSTFGEPYEAITVQKEGFLIEAAEAYITQNNIETESRFDVVSIIKNNNYIQVKHFKEAITG